VNKVRFLWQGIQPRWKVGQGRNLGVYDPIRDSQPPGRLGHFWTEGQATATRVRYQKLMADPRRSAQVTLFRPRLLWVNDASVCWVVVVVGRTHDPTDRRGGEGSSSPSDNSS